MQVKELLKLTQYNIYYEEEKELKQKISSLEIACRKLKISIRNHNQFSKGKFSVGESKLSHQKDKEKEL